MNKFNFREAYERIEAIKARLTEMAENLENDKTRDALTEAEAAEERQLEREMQILDMRIKANTPTIEVQRAADIADANRQIREAIARNERFELKIGKGVMERAWKVDSNFGGNASTYATSGLGGTNPFPVSTGDIVEPLYNKTIMGTIGAPLMTGLKGNYQWPIVEAFSATVNDEAAALGDTAITLTKLIAKPERIGIAVPITREALNETDNLIETVAREYMPAAVAELINKIMFSESKVTNATNLAGPFITASMKSANKLTYAHGGSIALADLLNLKGKVLGANVRPEGLCYVMCESTKAALEATPKWSGAAAAIIDDNGNINGVPVFTSSYVSEGTVLFGAFKYAPMGLFGEMSFIVDPYSQARKNAVDFVLNVDFAISVLRNDAFAKLNEAAS